MSNTAFDAGELITLIREEIQIFGLEPLVDGFTGEESARPGVTRILPSLNKAYREMRRAFFVQCYFTKVLTAGVNNYRFPETDYTEDGNEFEGVPFGFIEEAFLIDATDRILPLDVTTNSNENLSSPYRKNHNRRRPFAMWVMGDRFAFDATPDYGYTLRMLVDSVPDSLLVSTDKPKRLPYTLQEGLAIGGARYVAQKALAAPAGQSIAEGRFMRYKELKDEWEKWLKLAREMASSRVVNSSMLPLSPGIHGDGWYRGL